MAFDDPALNIDWKFDRSDLNLSDKDTKQPLFKDAELFDYKIDLYE